MSKLQKKKKKEKKVTRQILSNQKKGSLYPFMCESVCAHTHTSHEAIHYHYLNCTLMKRSLLDCESTTEQAMEGKRVR